jgi:hypothetical protein
MFRGSADVLEATVRDYSTMNDALIVPPPHDRG